MVGLVLRGLQGSGVEGFNLAYVYPSIFKLEVKFIFREYGGGDERRGEDRIGKCL